MKFAKFVQKDAGSGKGNQLVLGGLQRFLRVVSAQRKVSIHYA